MKFDPQRHHRRSIRLKGYDYTQPGGYFITICTYQRECLLGEIIDDEMVLNPAGEIVQHAWDDLPNHFPNVVLDQFCIMPNHVHGIVILKELPAGWDDDLNTAGSSRRGGSGWGDDLNTTGSSRRGGSQTRPYDDQPINRKNQHHGLPEIVRAFKSFSSRRINELMESPGVHELMESPGVPTWQRNYYEHIIRNRRELNAIRNYILANPLNWKLDQDNPI